MYHQSSSIIRALAVASSIVLVALSAAKSEDGKLPSPKEPPILTIEGDIGVTNASGNADHAMLEDMGLTSIDTKTPWFTGLHKFEGVPRDRIMKLIAAHGEEVVAVALNDYSTTIPLKDFADYGVLLALKHATVNTCPSATRARSSLSIPTIVIPSSRAKNSIRARFGNYPV